MKRILYLLPLLALIACQSPEQTARDVIASAKGAITAAQSVCSVQPEAKACPLIPKAVASENAAVTALESYCGFTSSSLPTDKCKPVKSAEVGLQVALSNLNQLTNEIKQAVKQ